MTEPSDVTRLLNRSRERRDHTLQATALVNEAYLRLVDQRHQSWTNRSQFLGIAATMMRRILINHAQAHRAAKRGGDRQRVTLHEAAAKFDNCPGQTGDPAFDHYALLVGDQQVIPLCPSPTADIQRGDDMYGAPGKYVGAHESVANANYAAAPNFEKRHGSQVGNANAVILGRIEAGKGVIAYRGHL